MAEGKNKIVVYADWLDNFEDLTDEELGRLMRHFFEYVNDMHPVLEERLLKIAWRPIQATLKRDLKKWEDSSEQRSEKARKAGLASAKARKNKNQLNSTKSTNELKVQLKPTKSTVSDSVSVISLKEQEEKKFNIYEEERFVGNWALCRRTFLDKPTGFDKLNNGERIELRRVLMDFTKEEIDLAMFGLFKQENISFNSMILRPKHFLEKVDVYLTAEKTKEYKLYGGKK